MLLGFKTKFKNGKETNFVNKIIKSLYPLVGEKELRPKLHTIRVDAKKRWKAGMLIHFATGVRTKYFDNFATYSCESVQEIEIWYLCGEHGYLKSVIVDGNRLAWEKIEQMAINDGFESVDEFKKYFRDNATYEDSDEGAFPVFRGRLIHWTKLTY